MYQHISYDREFVDYMMYLKGKYPKELFNLEGIGDQLDIAKFSRQFFGSQVVADTSVDANSNVDENGVVAYEVELPKSYFRLNSFYLIWKYMRKLYNTEVANEFLDAQITGNIYLNDAHGVNKSYCYNFSTIDVMFNGLPFVTKVKSSPPKHLSSFIGQLIHFTVYASNSILGAVGLSDLLIVMSYYVDNMLKLDKDITDDYKWKQIKQELQSFIFSCNQPFRAGQQSGFYNVSVYDDKFLEKMCSEYVFMDGTHPNIDTIKKLQILYLDLMNDTLRSTPITFPVTTACFAYDPDKDLLDEEFLDMIVKKNREFGFINIYAGKTSTHSSCCRLRSDTENLYFNQFGAGGTKIGSQNVVTLNLPRYAKIANGDVNKFEELLNKYVNLSIRISNTKRHLLQRRINEGRAPLYTLGFMDLNTQYSTTGVIGINEACELMGYDILNEDGQKFVTNTLDIINKLNDVATKRYSAPHNTEQVPGENSSVKMANKDRLLGYNTKYDLYSNQFIPLVVNADILDRIKLQGMFDAHMSGGAIAHLNIETKIEDYEQLKDLIRMTIRKGVIYHAINYNLQECTDGHMSVGTTGKCDICGGKIINNYTRVVGFLTRTSCWNKVRRENDYPNRVWYNNIKE
jgi:anaerobic ribonucleoside-triphosphate reductase